ncbi:2-methoxy-6-polyprenyl-1,4-benzoquinol methylase, mitochondrial [subsurface metagenome]|nr:methyltransferase domain-containing protein [Clostridia bacterium]
MDKTFKIQKKYNRNAIVYDLIEFPVEKVLYSKWRKKYFSNLIGKVLDVGIGTGKNIDYYNNEAEVTGIDFSKKMLEKAKRKLKKSGRKNISLKLMDIENLKFRDNSFDYVITSSVFCSVPNPIEGLKEIKRVLKPNGKLIMVEHVLSKNKIIAFFENLFNPLVKFLTGVNINRNTRQNIEKSGMVVKKEKNLALIDIFRLFVAEK